MPYRNIRPHPNGKPERNQMLVEQWRAHSEHLTYDDLGRIYNISRERVRQIIKRADFERIKQECK